MNAKNHVIAQLHTKGILNDVEFTAQSCVLTQKVSTLRAERRKKLTEDEDDELLDMLKTLNDILAEYEPSGNFDDELFGQIVNSITIMSSELLQIEFMGGLRLNEKITEKARCNT